MPDYTYNMQGLGGLLQMYGAGICQLQANVESADSLGSRSESLRCLGNTIHGCRDMICQVQYGAGEKEEKELLARVKALEKKLAQAQQAGASKAKQQEAIKALRKQAQQLDKEISSKTNKIAGRVGNELLSRSLLGINRLQKGISKQLDVFGKTAPKPPAPSRGRRGAMADSGEFDPSKLAGYKFPNVSDASTSTDPKTSDDGASQKSGKSGESGKSNKSFGSRISDALGGLFGRKGSKSERKVSIKPEPKSAPKPKPKPERKGSIKPEPKSAPKPKPKPERKGSEPQASQPEQDCDTLLKEKGITDNRSFKKWALRNHPDKGGNTSTFQSVSTCKDSLSTRRSSVASVASTATSAAPSRRGSVSSVASSLGMFNHPPQGPKGAELKAIGWKKEEPKPEPKSKKPLLSIGWNKPEIKKAEQKQIKAIEYKPEPKPEPKPAPKELPPLKGTQAFDKKKKVSRKSSISSLGSLASLGSLSSLGSRRSSVDSSIFKLEKPKEESKQELSFIEKMAASRIGTPGGNIRSPSKFKRGETQLPEKLRQGIANAKSKTDTGLRRKK